MTPDCTDSSGMVQKINVRNTTVPLSWHCDQKTSPGNVIYCGRLDGKMGCGPGYFAAVMNPTDLKGRRILPNRLGNDPDELGSDGKAADDTTRIRADDLGMPDFGMPYSVAE
jgi:hypothetical protein